MIENHMVLPFADDDAQSVELCSIHDVELDDRGCPECRALHVERMKEITNEIADELNDVLKDIAKHE